MIEAYFPPTAVAERALAHSATGRCLWYLGCYHEAAAQFEAGFRFVKAAREFQPAAQLLAEGAVASHFEAGEFEPAHALVAAVADAMPLSHRLEVMASALKAATGECDAKTATLSGSEPVNEAAMLFNRLVAEALPQTNGCGDATSTLAASLGEAGQLGRLLSASSEEVAAGALPHGPTRLALCSHAGQLAVAVGAEKEEWVRPLLVAALKEYELLQPKEPTLAPLLFRTLASLGTWTAGPGRDSVSAEGLLRSAVDHASLAATGHYIGTAPGVGTALSAGRGRIWHAQAHFAFAQLLSAPGRAEKRAADLAAQQAEAAKVLGLALPQDSAEAQAALVAALGPSQLRWALAFLPHPEPISAEAVGLAE